MTSDDLRDWQSAMGYTYDTACVALGVNRSTYADWLAGKSRSTGKPMTIDRRTALACAAIAAGLEEWTYKSRWVKRLINEAIDGDKSEFEHGYYEGFMASGEGYNSEYPFDVMTSDNGYKAALREAIEQHKEAK